VRARRFVIPSFVFDIMIFSFFFYSFFSRSSLISFLSSKASIWVTMKFRSFRSALENSQGCKGEWKYLFILVSLFSWLRLKLFIRCESEMLCHCLLHLWYHALLFVFNSVFLVLVSFPSSLPKHQFGLQCNFGHSGVSGKTHKAALVSGIIFSLLHFGFHIFLTSSKIFIRCESKIICHSLIFHLWSHALLLCSTLFFSF